MSLNKTCNFSDSYYRITKQANPLAGAAAALGLTNPVGAAVMALPIASMLLKKWVDSSVDIQRVGAYLDTLSQFLNNYKGQKTFDDYNDSVQTTKRYLDEMIKFDPNNTGANVQNAEAFLTAAQDVLYRTSNITSELKSKEGFFSGIGNAIEYMGLDFGLDATNLAKFERLTGSITESLQALVNNLSRDLESIKQSAVQQTAQQQAGSGNLEQMSQVVI
jgi:hypothetical protein